MPTSARAASIRAATTAADIDLARALFVEYARWLEVDLCFQGFDEELRTLPGAYAAPQGRLLLAGQGGQGEDAFACIALRPLAGLELGEVKRLYVQPAWRGQGWGGKLVAALVAEARGIGYAELKLDTLDWMNAARSLYEDAGFRACAPYYANPLPGVVYMSLRLHDAGARRG
ncbi:MAG TPA: GNAT family N-acetyltransferase [Casimicrobiaceae bacterium]